MTGAGSLRAHVAAVPLGCCPPGSRCVVCGPPPAPPAPETVAALVEAVRRDRGEPVRVGFFGGPLPTDAVLDAVRGVPFGVRVRPDLLDRASVGRLADRGCDAIELDAWSLDERALASARRPASRKIVLQQLEGIPAAGPRAGVVVAPGLPGTRHADAIADARELAPRVSWVRIHPILLLAGSELARRARTGTWAPMTLAEAVTVCRELVDVFREAGVEVVRVGLQPRHDGLGRVVGGPWHPALRQLVDARGTLRELHARLADAPRGGRVEIRCHPADETATRGPLNQHVRTLRAVHGLDRVSVRADAAVARGTYVVSASGRGP